jgi:hypothetical protein
VRSSGDLWDAPNLARGMRHKSEKDWERFLRAIVNCDKLEPRLREAINHAHDTEDYPSS